MSNRVPRFRRQPERFATTEITDRDLQIIATIERYRFAPTSLLVRLLLGSPQGIKRRLQRLYHRGLLNRFSYSNNDEANYYLDNRQALELLVARQHGLRESLDFQGLRRNREGNYAAALRRIDEESSRHYLFLSHELMISRFHGALELACRASADRVELATWRQGPELWNRVETPKAIYHPSEDRWDYDPDTPEHLPHRPDAFFTLRFPEAAPAKQELSFFYEADRKTTTNTARRKKKLRAHFHYVVHQRQHRRDYGVPRIRAVLIETLDKNWAELLRQEAGEAVISGPQPSRLFWFVPSDVLAKPIEVSDNHRTRLLPRCLIEPEILFRRCWATPLTDWNAPEPELFSLLDH